MKINVTLQVEISPEEYWNSYGASTSPSVAETREGVRGYVLNAIQQSALVEDTGAVVTLK